MEPGSLRSRISAAPVPFDRGRADAIVAGLPGTLQSGAMGALLLGTAGSSPYLGQLIERQGGWLAEIAEAAPEQTMAGLLAALRADAPDDRALGALLRQVKPRAAGTKQAAAASHPAILALARLLGRSAAHADAAQDFKHEEHSADVEEA